MLRIDYKLQCAYKIYIQSIKDALRKLHLQGKANAKALKNTLRTNDA